MRILGSWFAGRPAGRLSLLYRVLPLPPLLVLGACIEGQGSSDVIDSAGVLIVAVQQPTGALWGIDSAATLIVGGEDPASAFFGVRAARLASNGGLWIANAGDATVRLYDSTGHLQRKFGGFGQGPGQLRSLGGMWLLPSDSVLVLDQRSRSATLFDSMGTFVSRIPLGPPSIILPMLVGPVGSGLVVVSSSKRFGPASQSLTEGEFEDTLTVIVIGRDGSIRDTIGRYPNTRHLANPDRAPNGRPYMRQLLLPLSPFLRVLPTAGGMVVGSPQRHEVERYDTIPALVSVLRFEAWERSVTRADMAAARSRLGATLQRQGAPDIDEYLATVDRAPQPRVLPLFDDLLVDSRGIWLVSFPATGAAVRPVILVTTAGVVEARVLIPADAKVLDIAGERLLLLRHDSLDVERVEVLSLSRREHSER